MLGRCMVKSVGPSLDLHLMRQTDRKCRGLREGLGHVRGCCPEREHSGADFNRDYCTSLQKLQQGGEP